MSKAFNPFGEFDFTKYMAELKMPGVDIDQFATAYRRNLEAIASASQIAVEGIPRLQFNPGSRDPRQVGRRACGELRMNVDGAGGAFCVVGRGACLRLGRKRAARNQQSGRNRRGFPCQFEEIATGQYQRIFSHAFS